MKGRLKRAGIEAKFLDEEEEEEEEEEVGQPGSEGEEEDEVMGEGAVVNQ